MIAVIIPTLNEAAHIGSLLESLRTATHPEMLEIWVVDGGSQDLTRDIVERVASIDSRVRLLHNPERRQGAAVNLAAKLAHPSVDVLVRLDAHAEYPTGFVAAVSARLREKQADSVVVRLFSQGRSCFQRAVAGVSNSRLGTGGSLHRVGGKSCWVDHGHHAAFRRDRFAQLGGYDTRFVANEDAEFDARLRKAGGCIWLESNLDIVYWPRSKPTTLGKQYFSYGRGRAQNVRLHGGLKIRQLAAPLLVLSMLGSFFASPINPLCLLLPMSYFLTLATISLTGALRSLDVCQLAAGGALAIMHGAWGLGFLYGLFIKAKPN